MKTLYDFIGARPNATEEQLRLLVEQTRVRLKQTGAWYKDDNEILFRQAEEVLLDPQAREAYNQEQGIIPAPPQVGSRPTAHRRPKRGASTGQVVLLALLALVLVGILGFFSWDRFSQWPTGVYLKDPGSGKRVAVLVSRTTDHVFPDGVHRRACEVKILATGERRWMGEKQLRAEFDRGENAVGADRR